MLPMNMIRNVPARALMAAEFECSIFAETSRSRVFSSTIAREKQEPGSPERRRPRTLGKRQHNGRAGDFACIREMRQIRNHQRVESGVPPLKPRPHPAPRRYQVDTCAQASVQTLFVRPGPRAPVTGASYPFKSGHFAIRF